MPHLASAVAVIVEGISKNYRFQREIVRFLGATQDKGLTRNHGLTKYVLRLLEDTRDPFTYALSSNQAWAGYKNHQNPDFFPRLAAGQSPSILWLGCSDSRCPETTILGLQPGDVFVHRNIANIISPTDINTAAVIEYAVAFLKVKHVVLCGHTACGGAAAALGDDRLGGVLDYWLTPLKAVRNANAEELGRIRDDKERAIRIAEMNVEAGVKVLMANATIVEHIRDRDLQVHGTIFDIASGRIRDLGHGTVKPSKAVFGGIGAGEGEIIRGKHATLVFRSDGAGMEAR